MMATALRFAAVALALSQALGAGSGRASERALVSTAAAKDPAEPEATSAWRAYAKDGGGADLKRFMLVWEKTSGLRSGDLGNVESVVRPQPRPMGAAWPPRFDLICTGVDEERISPSTSSLSSWGREAPSDPPPDAKKSPTHAAHFHVELILGLYCRDPCARAQPVASIDADDLKGRFESGNMEWVDSQDLRWSRTTGAYSYVTRRRHKLRSQQDRTITERGTCRFGDPSMGQSTH